MTPLHLFRRVAVAEAVTWALLLTGMVLKYVTETTDLGVRVFGMLHGVVFVAYCVTTVVVGWPSEPVIVTVVGAADVGGGSVDGPMENVVLVSVTGPSTPLPLVSVTARPAMASTAAAAAAPNRIGGRLYQGSGAGSAW